MNEISMTLPLLLAMISACISIIALMSLIIPWLISHILEGLKAIAHWWNVFKRREHRK